MTEAQKRIILGMKADGSGAKRIASTLGISPNTVKSFLRRCDVAMRDASEVQRINAREIEVIYEKCKQCGDPIMQFPGMKKRVFCTVKCKTAWWNKHRAAAGRKSVSEYTCAYCGRAFLSNAPSRKYCGLPCYYAGRYGGEGEHVTGAV